MGWHPLEWQEGVKIQPERLHSVMFHLFCITNLRKNKEKNKEVI
jgi:hypothetical protein